MESITITIDTTNDAFSLQNGGELLEIARILANFSQKIINPDIGTIPTVLKDLNGNVVGTITCK